jgi:hypothetical protein
MATSRLDVKMGGRFMSLGRSWDVANLITTTHLKMEMFYIF